MKYSKLFGKTIKQVPKEAEAISHKLLVRGGYIDRQIVSGIFTLLPLGWRVFRKIEQIIREEINNLGCQELLLPALQPQPIWEKSGRKEIMEPPLFLVDDRHHKKLVLAPTHEEVITELVSRFIQSYKDLPFALYQIQTKFRNELRPTGGLLRTREFLMKDLYSFHANEEDLDLFYGRVIEAYKNIFTRCGFHTKIVEADSGSIGGDQSHEFMMICETGQSVIVCCSVCDWASNIQKDNLEKCPKCDAKTMVTHCIENGHIFKLGTKYSASLGAFYEDENDGKRPILMGCYGVGLGRLMATVVETHYDENGIIWPESIAPFDIHLVDFGSEERGEEVYNCLKKEGWDVLWDERVDVSPGEKLVDADLIGIPIRLVVSDKNNGEIEMKNRGVNDREILSLEAICSKLQPL